MRYLFFLKSFFFFAFAQYDCIKNYISKTFWKTFWDFSEFEFKIELFLLQRSGLKKKKVHAITFD